MTQQEQDANEYNKKYQVEKLTLVVLRNGSPLMTMLEAKQEAERLYSQGIRAE